MVRHGRAVCSPRFARAGALSAGHHQRDAFAGDHHRAADLQSGLAHVCFTDVAKQYTTYDEPVAQARGRHGGLADCLRVYPVHSRRSHLASSDRGCALGQSGSLRSRAPVHHVCGGAFGAARRVLRRGVRD